MIPEFIKAFDAKRADLKAGFLAARPESYQDIVRAVITVISDPSAHRSPDPERIHIIDDGDYQGMLLFVVGATGSQPSDYWYVAVEYGSCSGCDTLEAIGNYSSDAVTEEQADEYVTLALHIVQGLRKMGDSDDR